MKKRRISINMISWIESFLQDQTSTIKLPEFESGQFNIYTDIPQESPLSPILYLFYNVDLLDIKNSKNREDYQATAMS